MKKIILILFVALSSSVGAQDIFQKHLYSHELIMKYREEAGISDEQIEKIKSLYNTGQSAYNNKQWDLSAAMTKLEQLIAQPLIDSKAADTQLEKVLTLEAEVKKMRLTTLTAIKNTLTPEQQVKLNTHKGEFIAENSTPALLNALNSAAGTLNSASGAPQARLKIGLNSLTGTKPLYIIVDGDEKTETDRNALSLLDPADIDEIQVLKGSAATAVYGEKGKDGIIVLTLKKKIKKKN